MLFLVVGPAAYAAFQKYLVNKDLAEDQAALIEGIQNSVKQYLDENIDEIPQTALDAINQALTSGNLPKIDNLGLGDDIINGLKITLIDSSEYRFMIEQNPHQSNLYEELLGVKNDLSNLSQISFDTLATNVNNINNKILAEYTDPGITIDQALANVKAQIDNTPDVPDLPSSGSTAPASGTGSNVPTSQSAIANFNEQQSMIAKNIANISTLDRSGLMDLQATITKQITDAQAALETATEAEMAEAKANLETAKANGQDFNDNLPADSNMPKVVIPE